MKIKRVSLILSIILAVILNTQLAHSQGTMIGLAQSYNSINAVTTGTGTYSGDIVYPPPLVWYTGGTVTFTTSFAGGPSAVSVDLQSSFLGIDSDFQTVANTTNTAGETIFVQSVGQARYWRVRQVSKTGGTTVTASITFTTPPTGSVVKNFRFRVPIATVNAGGTLLPAIPGIKYRLVDESIIAVGGAVITCTTVDILATQAAGSVKLVANAVAALTQSALLRMGAANATILVDGASHVPNDVNTAITIGKTGASCATATNVDVNLTVAFDTP